MFIILFGIISIIGFTNRDLLKETQVNEEEYVPIVENKNFVNCNLTDGNTNISYRFVLSESKKIINVITTYETTSSTLDLYKSAANISNIEASGITATLTGNNNAFTLEVFSSITNINSEELYNYNDDLSSLSILIEEENDYNKYIEDLNSLYGTFTCVEDFESNVTTTTEVIEEPITDIQTSVATQVVTEESTEEITTEVITTALASE